MQRSPTVGCNRAHQLHFGAAKPRLQAACGLVQRMRPCCSAAMSAALERCSAASLEARRISAADAAARARRAPDAALAAAARASRRRSSSRDGVRPASVSCGEKGMLETIRCTLCYAPCSIDLALEGNCPLE